MGNALLEQSEADGTLADAAHPKSIECGKPSNEEHRKFAETMGSVRGSKEELPDFDVQ